MDRIKKLQSSIESNHNNVRFSDLKKLCVHYFGEARNRGTSHFVFKTPWIGDPRINIQKCKDGKAKAYQVKQVLAAIKKLEEQNHD